MSPHQHQLTYLHDGGIRVRLLKSDGEWFAGVATQKEGLFGYAKRIASNSTRYSTGLRNAARAVLDGRSLLTQIKYHD